MRFKCALVVMAAACCLWSAGCRNAQNVASTGSSPSQVFTIVAGSETKSLEPIFRRFGADNGVDIRMKYMGSVDMMNGIEDGSIEGDAVLPASTLWIQLAQEGKQSKLVKDEKSIARSPVVLGIKKSVAHSLGWVGKSVKVSDILTAAQSGKFTYMMTSATQSNSGAAAYLGYLYAFAGHPSMLTADDLVKPQVRSKVRSILRTINRSSSSSGFLKDLFLKDVDSFDGMVNYEALVIETNQELAKRNLEPLYAIYPVDGLAIADFPLGYIDRGDAAKRDIFGKLQNYLLSRDVQKGIQAQGRRTGLGMGTASADPNVFNPDWGIDTKRVISPVAMPSPSVIHQALDLYQTAFRKPALRIWVIDSSGSMASNGGEEGVRAAMRVILNQDRAKKYFLQAMPEDITYVITFSNAVRSTWRAKGNGSEMTELLAKVNSSESSGGTAIFSALQSAFGILQEEGGLEDRSPSVVLMTDGQNNCGISMGQLIQYIKQKPGLARVPVCAIPFGDADVNQLNQLTAATQGETVKLTNANDPRELAAAFRKGAASN